MAQAKSALDLLLGVDIGKFEKPTREIEIKRLSQALGAKVVFVVQGLDPDQMEKVNENAVTMTGKDVDLNMNEMQLFAVLEGVKEPNLKDKALREKFGAPTPKELVKKLLLAGEITKIYQVISELSGFADDSVEELKN